MHLKVPPLLLTGTMAVAMWSLSAAMPGLTWRVPGAALFAALFGTAGAVLCVMGVASFRRARTTVDPTRPGHASALVNDGVYRISRNPMYLGFLGLLTGWALYLSHLPAALLGPPAFVAYLNRFQIGPEETALRKTFGAAYDDYCQSVRRWL